MITAKDALDRLIGYLGDNPGEGAVRDIKRAVTDALRELATCHEWAYFISETLINFDAPQTTGTIAYVASTRLVTLTGATWPSWVAQYGVIVLSGTTHARIAKRVSSTVIELEAVSAPGTDVAALSTYTVYRDKYPLPADFHQGGRITRTNGREQMTWVPASQWSDYGSPYLPGGGRAWQFTFIGQPEQYGKVLLQVTPYPGEAETVQMVYKRMPRAISTWEYKTGTVTATAGANPTITGASTVWTAPMAGAVMRFAANTTGNAPLDIDNPPTDEARIGTFTSTTSVALDGTLANSYAGTVYSISDPVDVEYATMLNGFWACALKHLSQWRELKSKLDAVALWDMELRRAQAAELMTMERKSVGSNRGRWYSC